MRNTIRMAVLVAIIILLAFPMEAFGAAGTGDGSGGGKLQALMISNQPPADSAAAAKLSESLGEENNEGKLSGTIEPDPDVNEAALQQDGQNTAAQEQKRQKRIIIDIIIAIIAGSAAWWFYRKWRHPQK